MTTETSNAWEWVLVPREPTEAMEHEGIGVAEWTGDVKVIWSAMLAAAPPPAAARGDVRGLVDGVRRLSERWKSREIDGEPVSESRHMQLVGCAAMLDSLLDNYALAAEGVQAGGVERALEYLHPHLDAGTFAAPTWAIDLASILTGGAPLSQQPEARGVVDVTDAMVKRAMDVYWANGLDESEGEDFESMRLALTAALTGERNG